MRDNTTWSLKWDAIPHQHTWNRKPFVLLRQFLEGSILIPSEKKKTGKSRDLSDTLNLEKSKTKLRKLKKEKVKLNILLMRFNQVLVRFNRILVEFNREKFSA